MNVTRALVCGAGLLSAAVGLLHGQTEANPARIFGTVSAADTGRPLADALVELQPEARGMGIRWSSTRTDAAGAFEFRDVAVGGPFVLTASAARYLALSFRQRHPDDPPIRFTLSAGQQLDASIVLPRLGALSGRVVDPFGDPVPGLSVFVFKEAEVRGFRRFVAGGRPVEPRPTDDLGQFRVDGLSPGEYYVGILSGALTASPRFNIPNDAGGFVPTYFPGTTSIDEAQRIRLGPGEQQSDLTIAVVPGPTFRVAGRVIDSSGQPLARALMSISPSGGSNTSVAIAGRAQAASDGTFSFSNVPPGSYVVQGRSLGTTDAFTGEFGWSLLTVTGSDLSDLSVVTAGPSSLRGRTLFSEERSTLKDQFALSITVPVADLTAEPVIPIATRDPSAGMDSDGNFHLEQLWGRRLIRVASRTGWIVEKISLGGTDVTDAPIDFNGRHITGVEIVLTRRSASVSGRVTGDDGKPVGCRVMVFAADSDLWTPHSRFVATALADRDGAFMVSGLPPGNYLAAAVPQRVVAPTTRMFLHSIRARASSFTLPDGLTRDLALTLLER